MELEHIPVMVEEVMKFLGCSPNRIYVDATLGGGGHALEILKKTEPNGTVIGIDWDEDSLSEAKKILGPYGERVRLFHENFLNLNRVLKKIGIESVDGILLDLGLSSIQLKRMERGFSFKMDSPLDMRMDKRIDLRAFDLVNKLSQREIERIISEYGEERWASRIARAIVFSREKFPIYTTQQLRSLILSAIPKRFHSRRIDPSTKTFQALRIAVNSEMENLKGILESAWMFLKSGGRLCVISFHSLEDRIVKETFQRFEKKGIIRVLIKKPLRPSLEELKKNPRSRSAKLRCAEKI